MPLPNPFEDRRRSIVIAFRRSATDMFVVDCVRRKPGSDIMLMFDMLDRVRGEEARLL